MTRKYLVTMIVDELELLELEKQGWDFDIEEEPVYGICDDTEKGFVHEEGKYCRNWRPLDETE